MVRVKCQDGEEFYISEYYTSKGNIPILYYRADNGKVYHKSAEFISELTIGEQFVVELGRPYKVTRLLDIVSFDLKSDSSVVEISNITIIEEIEKLGLTPQHREELKEFLEKEERYLINQTEPESYLRNNAKTIKYYVRYFRSSTDKKYSYFRTDEEIRKEKLSKFRLEHGITYEEVTLENRGLAKLCAKNGYSQKQFNEAILEFEQSESALTMSEYVQFRESCFNEGITYKGVTPDNKKLAKLYADHGLSQKQFDEAILEFRQSESALAMPEYVQFRESCFNEGIAYNGVTLENREVAKLFTEHGLSQDAFNCAIKFRKKASDLGVPEHVLGKEIKEESNLLNDIEGIKEKTKEQISNVGEMIQEDFKKQFTYEWLRKNDPRNYIIGSFCNSEISLFTSKRDIWNINRDGMIGESVVMAPDVQNLVIKDSKGDIIAFAPVYINKEHAYAVIEKFSVKRSIEIYMEKSGDKQCGEEIFQAFQRGLKAFIEEYDSNNPGHPMQQVNIASPYTALEDEIARFEEATSNLEIPIDYGFFCGRESFGQLQTILYKREQKENSLEKEEICR